jgi:hypothetical protein
MKKYLIFLMVVGLFSIYNGQVEGNTPEVSSGPPSYPWIQAELIPRMIQSISTLAVNTAYDYSQRPVVGIIISDFRDDQGREIAIGREIAACLRAGLNKENQFYVYGSRHPVYKSLESVMAIDPSFKPVWQKRFQENLSKNFSHVQIDLILTGMVVKETEDHLKITASLVPLFKKIRLLESEFEKGNSTQAVFLSPSLSASDMDKALRVTPKGRLVILAHLDPKFVQTDPGRETAHASPSYKTAKNRAHPLKSQWDFKSPNDLSIWLDEGNKKLSLIKIKDWPDWKEKEYGDLFSGFEADTLWFDESLDEGLHSLFLSLSPAKDNFKTFSRTIHIKPGVTHYLFFSLESDLQEKPDIFFKFVIDSEKRPLPF